MVEPQDVNPIASGAAEGGLTGPVVRGGRWLFASTTGVYVLRFARQLVLMPLLDTDEFGLFFSVVFALNILRIFSETGVANIAVQRDDGDSESVLMTAWWINAIRGLVLATLLALGAPLLTSFMEAGPRLTTLLRVVSIIFVLEGFQSAGMIAALRRLAFNRIVIVQQGSALAAVTVSVVLGCIYRNANALVIGEIVGAVLLLSLSYIVLPVKPRLTARGDLARELWKLGKYIYFTHVCVFLLQQGDVLVVGRMLGLGWLGIYRMAYNYGNLPSQLVGQVVNRVMFPAYAKIKREPERLNRSLLRAQRFVVIIAAPACIALMALAPAMEAYGGPEKWAGLTLPLQLFAVGVFFACLNALNVSLLTALGRPERVTLVTMMQLVLWGILIVPMTRWLDINGAALITLLQAPAWVLLALDNGRLIGGGLREQLTNQLFALPAAAAMGIVSAGLWMALSTHIYVYAASIIVVGGIAFLGTLFFTARNSLREFMSVIRQALTF